MQDFPFPDDDLSAIPFDDSTALSYIAEFHSEIDPDQRVRLVNKLSPQGKRVATAMFDGAAANDQEALEIAEVLKNQAAGAAESR